MLCKTAFSVVVERAAKYARSIGHRLRVLPERCNSKDDKILEGYYSDLKAGGLPFSGETSGKYAPLTSEQFRDTLYEFRPKQKSSPMAQLADIYLWPICMGGYHRSNRTYARLWKTASLSSAS